MASLIPMSFSRAEKELILEAATGVASGKLPFGPGWSGSVSSDGLLGREFAFRTTYNCNSFLSISTAIGRLSYWYEDNVGYAPPPGWGWDRSEKRNALYIRPAVRLYSGSGSIDLGGILYREDAEFRVDGNGSYSSSYGSHFLPVIGVELGEEGKFIYGRFLDAFPLITGGGIIEFGFAVRSRRFYEHRFFLGIPASLGYGGEFRVYKSTAITAGFSLAGGDRENFYILTVGVKTILSHETKKRFQLE